MQEAPESLVKGKKRPFTGAEFLQSLRDGREVYIYGERVKDVTTHPAFRNAAVSVSKLYDALHADETKDVLTADTDTGSGGYTHRFFKAARSREDVIKQRDAIAAWARISYGWMGRTPDYKAAFLNTLGANAEFYGKFAGNARAWHTRGQEAVLYVNHALVNPPIDRSKPVEQVKDVYISIQKETDAGIYVSGAKVVATNSALTHYNFLGQNMSQDISDDSMVVMFMASMDTPGIKLICRPSYEMAAGATGSPWDYPLTSRFDENDAIFVFDNAFIPWENVFIHRDVETLKQFYPRSGFVNGFTMQGCTRLAVKLDFIAGLLYKAARSTGVEAFRGVQAQIGEVIGWRNLFWALTDAMCCNPDKWVGDAVLPNIRASVAYRLFATEAYPAVRSIVEKVIASGLIYLPSHARDFKNPDIDKYLQRYVRGSNGIDYKQRIKIMKLLWDAIGTEFGARHELYEMNYAGSHELVRLFGLQQAQASGSLKEMEALVDKCMADYDEDGWTDPAYHNNADISALKNFDVDQRIAIREHIKGATPMASIQKAWKQTNWKFLLAFAALAVGYPAASNAQTVVKIGIVNSFSGFLAAPGDEMQKGMDLYAKEHMKDLPPGVTIEVIKRDDTTNPEVGKRVAQELITRDKVNILLGVMGSPIAAAIAPLTAEAKIPLVLTNAAGVSIPRISPYVARVSFTQWQTAVPLGKWAAQQGWKKAVTMVSDFIPGHDAEAAFNKGYIDAGGQVLSAIRFPTNNPDFAPFVQKAKDAKPDVLFIFVPGGTQATAMIKAIKDLGLREAGINVVSTQDLVPDEELPNMGDAPVGLVTAGNYSTAASRPANATFLAAWAKEYGPKSSADFFAVGGWDGMAAVFDVIKQSKGKFTGDEAMAVLKGWKNPDSPRGPISIDPDTREIVQNIYMRRTEMKDGKLVNTEFETIPNVKDPWKELNPPK